MPMMLLSFLRANWLYIVIALAFAGLFGGFKYEQHKVHSLQAQLTTSQQQVLALGNSLTLQNSAIQALKDKAAGIQADLEKAQASLSKRQAPVVQIIKDTSGKTPSTCPAARPDVDAILKALRAAQ